MAMTTWDDMWRGISAPLARPQMGRSLEGRQALVLMLTLVVLYAAQAWAGYAFTSIGRGLAAIWLGNGMVAAGLVLLPRRLGLPLLAMAAAMDFSSAIFVGHVDTPEALLVISMDQFEATLASILVRRLGGPGLDPTRMRGVLGIMLFAVLPATLAAGTVGSLTATTQPGGLTPALWFTWVSGDFLGMMMGLPATLIFARPKRHRVLEAAADPTNIAIVLLVILLAALFASMDGPRGISLLIVVAAFLASFRLPPALVVVLNIVIVSICTASTMTGGGFAARWPGTDMERFLLLQFLTLPIVVCTLLGAALLSDRARSERHLRRALNAARVAHHRALAANGVKARFLSSMSHEMRTPLNSIMGHAELMEKTGDLPAGEARRAGAIRTSAETLSQLIDDVLDFTQIDGGRIDIKAQEFDLEVLCREALVAAQVMAEGRPMAFKLDLADGLTMSRLGDPRRLQQVLRQLLTNAVKFTTAGEIRLEVRERRDGEKAVVTFAVEDTGIGIDEEQLALIFRPFAQGDEGSRRRFGGAGLGLAIARGIVDAMGGTVGVDSRVGRGSRFWFAIPLAPGRGETATVSTVGLPAAEAPLRALVVDDHAVNRELAATFMQALGFEVICAENGKQAVDAVRAGRFDVVLMDLHMPVMDGMEATREIRRLKGASGQTPIVALTASASDDAIRRCLDIGMTAHLAKPIRGDALAAVLQESLAA